MKKRQFDLPNATFAELVGSQGSPLPGPFTGGSQEGGSACRLMLKAVCHKRMGEHWRARLFPHGPAHGVFRSVYHN